MWKNILGVLVLGWIGYSGYDYYTGPFYDAPPKNEGDFLLAFKGGVRGVMRGVGDRDQSRKYMSYDADNVPEWYMETWSICRKPKGDEVSEFESAVDMGPGGRLEAICEIDADGEVFVRAWMVSVPDL